LLADLARLRDARLPNETGGILLGIADMSRRSIHLAHAMPQPRDSHGSRTGFERGVVGVLDEVSRVVECSMHQLRYVGEWHSHPRLSSAWPSATDLSQLAWLDSELASEGLPGLMAIAADDGTYSIILSRRDEQQPEGAKRTAGGH
jgi:integrative and conjugative element protein (TIGR02256 family)